MPKYTSNADSDEYIPDSKANKRRSNLSLNFDNLSKNYLKNILVPIIDYLTQNNFLEALKDLKIKKQKINKKNSVPMAEMHRVLNHKIFKSLNKDQVKRFITKKILNNSKIHNKQFHLKACQEILRIPEQKQQCQFKSMLSKKIKKITNNIKKPSSIFKQRSLIVYLLKILCYFLEFELNQKHSSEKNRPLQENRNSQFKKKIIAEIKVYLQQENSNLRYLKNKLRQILNKNLSRKQYFQSVYEYARNYVSNEEKNLDEKNILQKDHQCMTSFFPSVVQELFQIPQDGNKITTNQIDKSIGNYLQKSLPQNHQIYLDEQSQTRNFLSQISDSEEKSEKRVNFFKPIMLIVPQSEKTLSENEIESLDENDQKSSKSF